MRRLGHSGKVDQNHVAVRDYLRGRGYLVESTASLGHGFPDLLVSHPLIAPYSVLVEVKAPGGTLTPDQVRFRNNWGRAVVIANSGQHAEEQLQQLVEMRD